HIGATNIPTHTIVGREPESSTSGVALDSLIKAIVRSTRSSLDQELGGDRNHDTIVPLDSQHGGLTGAATTQIDGIVHANLGEVICRKISELTCAKLQEVSETGSQAVWERIAQLLFERVDSASFAFLPSPALSGPSEIPFGTACPTMLQGESAVTASAPEQTVTGTLTPAQGTVVRPGQIITISFTLQGGNAIEGALFIIGSRFSVVEGAAPLTFNYEIPSDVAGDLPITVLTYGPGPDNYTLSTSLRVLPAAAPSALSASPTNLTLTQVGEQAQLRVYGLFIGDTQIELTGSAAGTLYAIQSGRTSIVSVSPEGVVEARGEGQETVLIANSGKTTSVSVQVSAGGAAAYRTAATVSAASYLGGALAPESIAAAFGVDLTSQSQTATSVPLPTSLSGLTIGVRDSVGTERPAPLFFVSPSQINYQIPRGTAPGVAVATINRANAPAASSPMQIAVTEPGLFSANANGQGVAAAVLLRVRANGAQSYEPVARFDPAQNKFVALPIDLGPSTDQVFLLLFGTGIRFRDSLSTVTANIGGTEAQVLYAGEQGGFVGLDQLNVRVPRSLVGRGEVEISLAVGGRAANPVKVSFR
ncbi:MAG: hypothetical protein ACREEM_45950, partial [Blastocatellia bacterium]